jgi:hypothetical protein
VFDYRDGLPEDGTRSRIIPYDSVSGKCYLFSLDNLVVFSVHPQSKKISGNRLLIQEISSGNSNTLFHPSDTIQLHYDENNLSLQTAIIDFESTNNYTLEYKLNNTPD